MGPRRRRRRAPAPGAARGQLSATWAGETRGQRTPWPYPAASEGLHGELHVGIGEEKFCFAPRSALWRREADGKGTQRHAISERSRFHRTAVDFYVHRSAEEQDPGGHNPDG